MRLESLYYSRDTRVLNEYLTRLRNTLRKGQVITEGKRVVVTTEIIDDDDGVKVTKEAREEFINKAKSIGQFDNPGWVRQIINGLKQTGRRPDQPNTCPNLNI